MSLSSNKWLQNLRSDLPASLVVFLVALPLSLGISLASGAPMKAGLIAAAIGGIVIGLFTGAPFQVSGPAAGLSVMILGFVQKYGFEATCIMTVIGGLTQVIFGLLGAAQIAFVISPAVIHAMLAGIGILIALGQVHVLVGFAPKASALLNITAYAESLLHMNTSAAMLGLVSLAVLLAWNQWGQKRIPVIPGSLMSVLAGTGLATIFNADVPRVQIGSDLLSGIKLLQFGNTPLVPLIIGGLGLALVASAESLLCAVATDKIHSGPRVKLGKELVAQGIGNTLSGLVGGLPITGVIVRSSANISAGAKSQMSAMLHGVWILVFAVFFSSALNLIPLSVLAALLIYTGVKLVKIGEIKKLMAFKETLVYFVTLFCVVFVNLLWGIGIGFALATVLMIQKMIQFHFSAEHKETEIDVRIKGSLTFLNVPKLLNKLNALPKQSRINLSLEVDHLDHAVIEAVNDWRQSYEKSGGIVVKRPLADLWADLMSSHVSNKNSDQKYLTAEQKSVTEIPL